jgi:hypothetical protein
LLVESHRESTSDSLDADGAQLLDRGEILGYILKLLRAYDCCEAGDEMVSEDGGTGEMFFFLENGVWLKERYI